MRPARTKARRLPRQSEPVGLMNTYTARINRMRADMIASVREHVVPILEAIAAEASRVATTDAVITLDFIEKVEGGWVVMNKERTKRLSKVYSSREEAVKRLQEIEYFKHQDMHHDAKKTVGEGIDEARAAFAKKWPRSAMASIVEPIARDVPTFQANQLNRQLSAAIGSTISLDVVGSEAWIANAAAEWTHESVALIKSIPDFFFPELEKYLTREVADGARWEELATTIEQRYDVTASRARLIARDQIGKFVGDLNRVRQQDLGINSFVWRTMGDERVRDDETAGPGEGHVERNGKTYRWDDPPEGETPGQPVQCRCYGEAVITDQGE